MRNRPAGLDVDRRPTALVLKSILGISSIPVAAGFVPLPGSLEAGPPLFGQVAAGVLCGGCLISILGIVYGYLVEILDGLSIEALGLVGVASGAGMYAFALTGVANFDSARIAFGMSLGIAGFAVVQYVLIAIHRRRFKKVAARAGLLGDGR